MHRILNLSDLEKSGIKYKISQFPDGQQDIVIKTNMLRSDIIQINSRFNSFRDLELIICANKALRRLGCKTIHLYIPYLLGARSDRCFQEGGNSYLVDIIAPIINAQQFESVTVLDVHSDVAPACINNLIIVSNNNLVRTVFQQLDTKINNNCSIYSPTNLSDKITIVAPDGGAAKKIYKLAEEIGFKGDIVICSKSRDTNGQLTKTIVPDIPLDKDIIIIDDICDGGRTFNNIIAAMNDNRSGKNYLAVTHGIFSAGYTELLKHFDTIFTTNSVKNIGGLDGNTNKKINVIQMNVI